MPESVIRGTKKGFTVLYNSALRDERLSLKAIGLFAVMQSFPENWEYSVAGLAARVRAGRDAVRRCLKELEDAGYLVREQAHQENGKFGGAVYTLREQSVIEMEAAEEETAQVDAAENALPLTEKPSTVNTAPGNRPQVNKHLSKETIKQHPIAPQGAKSTARLFDCFWEAYPRKENRAAALRAWRKLAPDSELCRIMAAALEWQRKTAQWIQDDGQFIPSPASWLRGRRWEDEPGPADRAEKYGWEEYGYDGI
nr:helix-turn-helix domain-containing protein [uncultured Oscillibacter sp.]